MQSNFDSCLKHLLVHEGGYVNHPSDPGGRTNLGVTQRVWEEWMLGPVTEDDMRALTPAKVYPLYKRRYWDVVGGDELPSGVDYCVFDAAVNSGPGAAVKWLQQIVGTTPDGGIGPKTLAAVATMPPAAIVEAYQAKRLGFMKSLPTWSVFGKGWERRVNEVADAAAAMANKEASQIA